MLARAKMMGATTPGSVHFFCAQRIESTVAQLPQQRSRVDRDDITEMTSGGSAQLWRKERSSLGVCGSHLADQGQPFSDKDKVALHGKTNKHQLSVSISFLHIGI